MRVSDFLEDTEGAQSVQAIISGTALSRELAEVTLSRGVKAKVFARVGQGLYELVPPAPLSLCPSEPPPHIIEEKAAVQKAAAEKVTAAHAIGDFQLLEQLLAAANGNFIPGPRIRDLTPVCVMLANGAILEDIISTLEARVDRRAAPGARPITSWSDHWLLCAIAGTCLQRTQVLRIVDSWLGKMGPAKPVESLERAAGARAT